MMEGDPCDSEDLHGLRMAIREKELCVFRRTNSYRDGPALLGPQLCLHLSLLSLTRRSDPSVSSK